MELSHDLINIDTKDIADSVVCETVKRIKSIGEEQYIRHQEEQITLIKLQATPEIKEDDRSCYIA